MKRRIHLLNCLAATLIFSGCMGYQLGGSRPEGIESVTLAPIVNRTGETAIELQVTHAISQRIQFDGRMKLVNMADDADAVIEVTLTKYDLTPISYRSDQRTTPENYRLRITGVAELKDPKTGEILSTSATYGEATFEFKADLTSSKRDALPVAAKEIAKFMVDDLIERW
ncbi:MAG: LPS assembly lipoprotein LptE [Pontiella sp.]